jgi:two-component system LytT family response regulator
MTMTRIRTLIVDDEVLARRRIQNLLRGREEFDVIGECANGALAVQVIIERRPDLLFLDVQMPDLDGLGVLARVQVSGQLPVTIFVTAYDQYALKAFEFHAVDYLLKPFDDERFERALAWARTQLEREHLSSFTQRISTLLEEQSTRTQQNEPATPAPAKSPIRLAVKSAGRVQFVRTDEIDWIEAESYYVRLHAHGKSHLLRETLGSLETQLDPRRFVRIHRSTIVNIERIKELQPQSHGEYTVILQSGAQLRLSRSYREKLRAILGADF